MKKNLIVYFSLVKSRVGQLGADITSPYSYRGHTLRQTDTYRIRRQSGLTIQHGDQSSAITLIFQKAGWREDEEEREESPFQPSLKFF